MKHLLLLKRQRTRQKPHNSHMDDYISPAKSRECHVFANPHGLRSQVVTGTGMGWHFRTPEKPIPVTWV